MRAPVALVAVALIPLAMLAAARASAGDDFPPYLSEAERLPLDVQREVSDIWTRRTVSRVASGEPARVPLPLYVLFVDVPEVTAAAGRHLGIGAYRVTRLGPDAFEVADGEGTHGDYRAISKARDRRVLVARVQRTMWLLGDVRGASLTLLTFHEERDDDGRAFVTQRVETVARIDHRVAALIAHVLVPLFPDYADRKFGEVFRIAARVSAWSVEDPVAFCRWLAAEPDGARHRETFAPHVAPCRAPATEPAR